MSISSYSELQTALTNYTHRADLTSRIPEFIQMGEADLNARLRTKDQEDTASSSMSTSTNTLALPAGFLEAQRLEYTSDLEEITFVASPLLIADTGTGQPGFYTIRDSNMVFEVTPNSAYAVKLYYRKKYDIATDLTNWLLTNYPNLYLYSAMVHAMLYIANDSRASAFRVYLDNEIELVKRSEARKRSSGGVMQNDLPVGYGRINILNG
jgi:hypothetical protein